MAHLYVKEQVEYAEYFIAPDISSLSFGAYLGAYLGELTGNIVQGLTGDKNLYKEFKGIDQELYYVPDASEDFEVLQTLKADNPAAGDSPRIPTENLLEKIMTLANSIWGVFQESKELNPQSSSLPKTPQKMDSQNQPPTKEPFLDFLKKHIFWLLPSVILLPLLLFWGIRKFLRKPSYAA